MAAVGGMLGHGGIVVLDASVDMARQARYAMHLFLCGHIARQVHAMSYRLDARRRSDRQDRCRRHAENPFVARLVRHYDQRLVVRDGQHDAAAFVVGARSFSRKFWSWRGRSGRLISNQTKHNQRSASTFRWNQEYVMNQLNEL